MSVSSITLAGAEGPLEAILEEPSTPPRFAAVVAHPHPLYGGTMDNLVVRRTARALVRAGATTLRFNFRGVGGSAGTHDVGRGERSDLSIAIADLAGRFPNLSLLVAGYSFGAAVSLSLLRPDDEAQPLGPELAPLRERTLGVMALAPPLTLYDFDFLRSNRMPLGLICGERDALTPAAAVEAALASWSEIEHYEALAQADHDLGTGTDGGLALDRALEACLMALVR